MTSLSRWIPAHRRAELRLLATRSNQVVILAALTGAVTGLFVAGLERVVVAGAFDHVLRLSPWVIGFLPGLGLLAGLAIRTAGGRASANRSGADRASSGRVSASTSDEYLHAFHDPGHRLRWHDFATRMIAAVATLGTGSPVGLEGPSMYAGAIFGTEVQGRFPRSFRDADRRVLLTAGAAAGVAAIFKAPATGAVFAMEVPYQGDLARRMLLPALVASAAGYLTFAAVNGTEALFQVEGAAGLAYRDLAGAVAVGIIAGLGARLFSWVLRRAKALAVGAHPLLAVVVAGTVIGVAYAAGRLLTGRSLMLGAGYEVLAWAQDPTRSAWLLLAILVLRCLATSAAVVGSGVGGLFIPLVVGGALTGAIVGGIIDNQQMSLFIVIGIAAFLGAGYRVPLAAVMFVAETTGRPSFIVPGLLAAVAAELIMGRSSVTPYQRDTNVEAAATTALPG